jgi:hypothetical protein
MDGPKNTLSVLVQENNKRKMSFDVLPVLIICGLYCVTICEIQCGLPCRTPKFRTKKPVLL